MLEIHLLGGFTVSLGDEPLPPVPSRYARLLFAYLAHSPDRSHPRARLAAALWPDQDESKARKRLSHTLWQVQDALAEVAPGRRYIDATLDTVQLGDAPSWVDVCEFELGLDEVTARGALDPESVGTLRRCVDLYRGDFLAGYYEPWVIDEQERLGQRYVDALTQLVTAAKRRSNFEEALTYARRLTHHAPLREDVHREAMRLFVLMGRHGEALQQYERCRTVLGDELGAEPEAATSELAARITRTRQARPPEPVSDRAIATQRLVGRRTERQRILDRLDRSLGRRGETVLVEGEPGIGKSRLLEQVADDARWRGFTVLYGACLGEATARPYQALVDALQPEVHPVRVAQLRASLGDHWLRDAARLIPGLAPRDSGPGVPLDASEASDRMRESLVRLILALSDVAPTALVIDDLQWADTETLDVLRALAQRHDRHPLLIVLSYRDQEAREAEQVWEMLRALDRVRTPERIGLRALSAFETAELVGDAVDAGDVAPAFTAAIQRESGGNPLYVVELLRALRDRGSLSVATDDLASLDVPSTSDLHAVIGERVDQVTGNARSILRLAAVLGASTDVDTLTTAATVPADQLPIALDELLRRNLLEPRDDRVGFTHAAARAVVLERLTTAELLTLHAAAADALEQLRVDRPEALAHHLLEADLPGRALPYLRSAAERAISLSAYASAKRLLDRATALLDVVPLEVSDRFDLHALHEHVLDVLGERGPQAGSLAQLVELAGSDVGREVEARRRKARFLGMTDAYEEAESEAIEAVRLSDGMDPAERGAALVVLGRVRFWAGRFHDAVDVLADATEALRGHDAREAEACFALGTAYTYVQDLRAAIVALERARDLYERVGDQRGVIEATGALGDAHAVLGDVDLARHQHEQAIDGAREIGFLYRASVSLINLGNLLQHHGDPAGALRAYDESLEGFRALEHRRGIATVELNRAWLHHRWLGDDASAEEDADRALDFFTSIGDRGVAALTAETLASIERRRGQLDAARVLLERALAGAEEANHRAAIVQVHRGLAELSLDVGDAAETIAHVRTATTVAEAVGIVDIIPDLAGLEAEASLLLGDRAAAAAAIQRGLDRAADATEPHVLHHRAAAVARFAGQLDQATVHSQTAAAALESALAGLAEHQRERAMREVPVHAAIAGTAPVRVARHRVVMARADAPTGRALNDDELITVELHLPPDVEGPSARRERVLHILDQARAQGAIPTLDDLVGVVGVSRATVRRDLAQLRDAGHEVATRGSRSA